MATTQIKVEIGVSADTAKAVASIGSLKTAFAGVTAAAQQADNAAALPNTARQLTAIRATLAGFRSALVAYAGLSVVGSVLNNIAQRVDTFTTLNARIKLAAGSTVEAVKAFTALRQMAIDTQVPLGDLATLYGRIGQAVRLYTGDSTIALKVTETLALGLRASGSTAEESSSAILQFSQAINSGRLAGEEFRAVYEAAPRYIFALADALGLTAGQLYELSKQQQLTSDVLIKGSQKAADILRTQASEMPRTIGTSMKSLSDSISEFLERGASASGLINTITGALDGLARNADLVVTAFAGLAAGAIVAVVLALSGAVLQLAKNLSFAAIAAAALKNPLLAVAAAGTLGASFFTAAKALDLFGKETEDAAGSAKLLGEQLKTANEDLFRAKLRVDAASQALATFYKERSVKKLQEDLEDAELALRAQKDLVDALREAWTSALGKAAEYRQKASDTRQEGQFKAADAARASMKSEAAQRDASIEQLTEYMKVQRALVEIQDRVNRGDITGASELAKQSKLMVDRQGDLVSQLRSKDQSSAAKQIAEQTAKLYEAMASIEEAQAKETGKAAEEQNKRLVEMTTQLDGIKTKIQEIKDADLAIKENKLVAELKSAETALQNVQGRINELKGQEVNVKITFDQVFAGAKTPNMEEGGGFFDGVKAQAEAAGDWVKGFFTDIIQMHFADRIKERGDAAIAAWAETATQNPTAVPVVADTTSATGSILGAIAVMQATADQNPVLIPTAIGDPSSWWDAAGNPLPIQTTGYASGGAVRPPNAIDNILGWFNRDEFVMRAAAVRKYGMGFMDSINNMTLPRFAMGGPVGTPVNVVLDGRSFGMQTDSGTGTDLLKALRLEVLRRGKR